MMVICIKPISSARPFGYGDEIVPYVGQVLTVRGEMSSPLTKKPAWTFVEIVNTPRRYLTGDHEIHFGAEKFRPVRDTTVGVEALRKILNGEKVREKV